MCRPRTALAVLALTVLALALPACRSGGGSAPAAQPAAGSSSADSGDSKLGAPSPAASPELPDGRHPVYLTGIDVSKGAVTFDLIQFLTGAEAKKAWVKVHPEQPDGPDNDYFIVNDNPKLRTLPVSSSAAILVIDQSRTDLGTKQLTLAALPAFLAPRKPAGDNRLYDAPFWLTVTGGQIVKIEEQFIP